MVWLCPISPLIQIRPPSPPLSPPFDLSLKLSFFLFLLPYVIQSTRGAPLSSELSKGSHLFGTLPGRLVTPPLTPDIIISERLDTNSRHHCLVRIFLFHELHIWHLSTGEWTNLAASDLRRRTGAHSREKCLLLSVGFSLEAFLVVERGYTGRSTEGLHD